MGIPADALPRIFGAFEQDSSHLTWHFGGLGIGLTICEAIVDLHGGRVTAHSDGPGRGSRFEIRLPRLIEALDHFDDLREERRSIPSRAGGTIVLVEDHDDNRQMLQTLLELDGYTVHAAENGPLGLAAIERHRPDVALIDIGLPGLNGYEVAKQVRANLQNSRTYLVALTGYGQPQDVQAAIDAGFDNHIVKPLDPAKLAQIMEANRSGVSSG